MPDFDQPQMPFSMEAEQAVLGSVKCVGTHEVVFHIVSSLIC